MVTVHDCVAPAVRWNHVVRERAVFGVIAYEKRIFLQGNPDASLYVGVKNTHPFGVEFVRFASMENL
jgi:hypothetical protein